MGIVKILTKIKKKLKNNEYRIRDCTYEKALKALRDYDCVEDS